MVPRVLEPMVSRILELMVPRILKLMVPYIVKIVASTEFSCCKVPNDSLDLKVGARLEVESGRVALLVIIA